MTHKIKTVGDLIDNLSKFPRSSPVMISSDEEGNEFKAVDGGYVVDDIDEVNGKEKHISKAVIVFPE